MVPGDSLALRLEDRDSGQCLVYAPGRIVHVLDWVEGWGQTGRGRIHRIAHPELAASEAAREVRP